MKAEIRRVLQQAKVEINRDPKWGSRLECYINFGPLPDPLSATVEKNFRYSVSLIHDSFRVGDTVYVNEKTLLRVATLKLGSVVMVELSITYTGDHFNPWEVLGSATKYFMESENNSYAEYPEDHPQVEAERVLGAMRGS